MAAATSTTHAWWQRGVIYQVYPLSFQDSDGDGFGDLRGILSRLDHLQWLGVDALWLSPIHPSPMADWGYDVADYCDVDPRFGTLADVEALIAEAHRRGLKVLLDFVPNHTSEQHPWFVESRSSRHNPKRHWYHWRDGLPDTNPPNDQRHESETSADDVRRAPVGRRPPNNWISVFGGSAWTLDDATGQYYLHSFLRQQPDLDWRHPEVRAAMHEALRFWLRRGVDGFRVDVIHHLAKDPELRDNPPNPDWSAGQNPYRRLLATRTADLPEVHEVIAGIRAVVDELPDRMLVGELYLPLERLMVYYGAGGRGLQLPFNFQLIRLPWEARTLGAAVDAYEAMLPTYGWPSWVLGNHDKSRVASRVGAAQARVAAMMLLTLRGTPTMYYGDEIGMRDVPIPPERVRDPFERNVPGLGLGRDPERTPMQWDGGANAGFTAGEPWLPVAADAAAVNVAAQRVDPGSLLTLYRRLLALRRAEPALAVGPFAPLRAPGELLAWVRKDGDRRFLVATSAPSRRPGRRRCSTSAARWCCPPTSIARETASAARWSCAATRASSCGWDALAGCDKIGRVGPFPTPLRCRPAREGTKQGRSLHMAMNSGTTKRQREMARRQRQQEKAAKMQKRQEEKRTRTASAVPGEDPDIAGIVPGPQPREDDDFDFDVEVP